MRIAGSDQIDNQSSRYILSDEPALRKIIHIIGCMQQDSRALGRSRCYATSKNAHVPKERCSFVRFARHGHHWQVPQVVLLRRCPAYLWVMNVWSKSQSIMASAQHRLERVIGTRGLGISHLEPFLFCIVATLRPFVSFQWKALQIFVSP